MPRRHTLTVRLLLTVLLAAGLVASSTGPASTHGKDDRSFPDRIELPDGFRPEGIAIGHGRTAWFGSLADGDIYEADLRTGAGEVISEGPGTSSVGLKVDRCGRLFVAGGPAGNGRVVDTDSGKILATYQFTDKPSFVNDVVLTKRFAWFTDSMNAVLYGVPLGRKLAEESDVVRLPLTGDWEQVAGFNANGIARTPDRRALLVVQSATGFLFRVNPRTGNATRVDLGGAQLTNGDGMLLIRRTLYVAQNRDNKVAVIRLNRSGTEGDVRKPKTSPDFDVPTTIARFGKYLYLPNARFTTTPTPTTEYSANRIRR